MTKKKTTAKESSEENNADQEVKEAKTAKKKTAAKKKTTKKTTKKTVAKKTAAKKTTKKAAAKKTATKKATPKTEDKTSGESSAAALVKEELPADNAAAVPAAETVKQVQNNNRPVSAAEKVSEPQVQKNSSRKEPEKQPARQTASPSVQEQNSDKDVKASAEKSENRQNGLAPLPGEKISSALLALESQHLNNKLPQVEKKTESEEKKTDSESKTVDSAPPSADSDSTIPTVSTAENAEDTDDQTKSEKSLSKSARKRRNQRNNKKKRLQEKAVETADASEAQVSPPAEEKAENDTEKPRKRKETGRNMLINVIDPGEIRVAIAGKKGLEEIYIEKSGGEFVHGNIFKGIVENVEPNLQAAFVNIGAEKNGFLHVRDVIYPFGGFEEILGTPDRQPSTQKRPPINHMLHKGQEILVQITREQVATKGPSLTTYISLPGRYLVLMPAVKKRGVSKKITNKAERDELKKALEQLNPPHDMGFIIRTAGMGKGREELQRDLDYLTMLWEAISNHTQDIQSPVAIYQESDLVIRAIRDYFTDSIDNMIIDSEEEFNRAQEFLSMTMPDEASRSSFYSGKEPLFSKYNIEDEISALFSRSVRLKSGGELIIEQTEAMVTIDVNTGRFVKGKSSHDMVLKINKEAAVEIAKQLRLRDMGGLVMIDFIDMEHEEDRKTVENTFRNAMQADRAKVTMLPISQLGILEMTRQRMRQSLELSHFAVCKHCGGTGVIKNIATLETEFLRSLRYSLKEGKDCIVKMNPDTALAVANKSKGVLAELEREFRISITLINDHSLRPDKFIIK